MISTKIIEISGKSPGPTLAIFAGVHGNELSGVLALQELIPKLELTKGKLYIAFANPPAIAANVRMLKKNLNRCFYKNNNGTDPEDILARELMSILDKCDALLDLHMFYDDDGLPFAICEENSINLASKFDVDIISTNWSIIEPGASDGYMYLIGKLGICVECGPISKAEEYKEFTKKTIFQFLYYFEMTSKKVEFSETPKRIIKAKQAILKNSEQFQLRNGLSNFEKLTHGQVIATEGNKSFVANEGECIIFPHYKAIVGEEAYIIGDEIV